MAKFFKTPKIIQNILNANSKKQDGYLEASKILYDFYQGNHKPYIRRLHIESGDKGQEEYKKRIEHATVVNYCGQAIDVLASFIYSRVVIRRVDNDIVHSTLTNKVWKPNSQANIKHLCSVYAMVFGHQIVQLQIDKDTKCVKYHLLNSLKSWAIADSFTGKVIRVITFTDVTEDNNNTLINDLLNIDDDSTYQYVDIYEDNVHKRWLLRDGENPQEQEIENELPHKLNELFLFYKNTNPREDNIYGGITELTKIKDLNTRLTEVNIGKDYVLNGNAYPILASSADLSGITRSIEENTISLPEPEDWIKFLTLDTLLEPYFQRSEELKDEIFEAVGLSFIGRGDTNTGAIKGATGLDKLFSADTTNILTKQNNFTECEIEEVKTLIRFIHKNRVALDIDKAFPKNSKDLDIDIYFGNKVLDGNDLNQAQATTLALSQGALDLFTVYKAKAEYKDLTDTEILNIIKQEEINKQKEQKIEEKNNNPE